MVPTHALQLLGLLAAAESLGGATAAVEETCAGWPLPNGYGDVVSTMGGGATGPQNTAGTSGSSMPCTGTALPWARDRSVSQPPAHPRRPARAAPRYNSAAVRHPRCGPAGPWHCAFGRPPPHAHAQLLPRVGSASVSGDAYPCVFATPRRRREIHQTLGDGRQPPLRGARDGHAAERRRRASGAALGAARRCCRGQVRGGAERLDVPRRELLHRGRGPSCPFRVPVFAARTLNAIGQFRVLYRLRKEHLSVVCGRRQEEKGA